MASPPSAAAAGGPAPAAAPATSLSEPHVAVEPSATTAGTGALSLDTTALSSLPAAAWTTSPTAGTWVPAAGAVEAPAAPANASAGPSGPAAAPAALTRRANVLLETDVPNNRVLFDRVYLNDLHVLRKVSLRNVSGARLLVKLRSSLGRQVAFQLANDNFSGDVLATGDAFNEVFNTVGHVDEVELPRDEQRDLIIAYRPDPDAYSADTAAA